MTKQEMIDEMLQMQRALDDAIYKEHNVEYNESKCKLAMIDEIGEFNHEVKSSWCWWKKTQKPIDREKALEELVDIWHFALSLMYHRMDDDDSDFPYTEGVIDDLSLSYSYLAIIGNYTYKMEALEGIGKKYGFTLEDVYEAYKKKNQVNYERLANNY